MKRFRKLLNERTGEKAHRDAVAMGLKYKGFGYWVDPNTGKVTYKTENDELVPVNPDVESDKWKGDAEIPGGGPMGNGPGAPGGTPGAPGGKQQPVLGQGILGTASPGMAQVQKRLTWEPGPDGSTCVDSENPKPDVPVDTFVGKTNYYQWTSGPDGSNYKKLSYDNIKQTMVAPQQTGVTEGWRSYDDDSAHKPAPREKQLKLPGVDSGQPDAGERVKQIMQPDKTAVGRTNIDARRALARMPEDARLKQIRSLLSIKNRGKDYKEQETFDAEMGKANDVWRAALKLPAKQKDAAAVQEMNKGLSGLVSDPKFDLDQFDEDEFEEGGAFGDILVKDDYVVKKGNIGPDEMKALYAMRDNPAFPTLINGRFDGPFKHKSSLYNNPVGADDEHRREGESQYWDPDDKSYFDDMFPLAPGTYAMSRAKGRSINDTDYDQWHPDDKEEVVKKFLRARGALHMAGFSHNDMHGGNIFMDDDGNPTIIDLGLAKDDPLSALMEATGSFDYINQQDYQLNHHFSGASLSNEMRSLFDNRLRELEERMQDEFSPNAEDYDDYDEEGEYSQQLDDKRDALSRLLEGGIRMKGDDFQLLKDQFPMLGDRKKVLGLIAALYKGIAPNELEDRMSKAFDKRQDDAKKIRIANQIRKLRGEKSISVRNPNVVPPRHLDFDD